jgi:hypothetical protein
VQSNIFSDATAISRRLHLNLIIAMRESTYVQHTDSPTFNAFDFDPMLIDPPEIAAVIAKRFFLAENLSKGKPAEFTANNGIKLKVDDISQFVSLVKSSVLGTEIGNRIEVLANNDIRLGLRMTREFLASGYSDPAKALEKFQETGQYRLPVHEAFRSILLGNQLVYNEKYSVIGNPFDSKLDKNNMQLLRLFLLAGFVKRSTISASTYIPFDDIKISLTKIGFPEDATFQVIKDLCKLRFIQNKSHSDPQTTNSFCATRLGGYVIKQLLSDLTYLENVSMDTFITDTSTWETLKEISQNIQDERNIVQRLEYRISKTDIFYKYMHTLYRPMLDQAIQRGLDSIWLTDPLSECEVTFNKNCSKAINSAHRYYIKKN